MEIIRLNDYWYDLILIEEQIKNDQEYIKWVKNIPNGYEKYKNLVASAKLRLIKCKARRLELIAGFSE